MLKAFTLRNYKNFKDEITIDFKISEIIHSKKIVFQMESLRKC